MHILFIDAIFSIILTVALAVTSFGWSWWQNPRHLPQGVGRPTVTLRLFPLQIYLGRSQFDHLRSRIISPLPNKFVDSISPVFGGIYAEMKA